jgi:3-oxoacyl-[acyl-carrier protein] reductase
MLKYEQNQIRTLYRIRNRKKECKEMKLEGKVAVVTASAGAGIGKATVKLLAREGANVVVSDTHPKRIQMVAEEIAEETGREAIAVRCDVRNKDEVEDLMAQTLDKFGKIDILVNNAGTTRLAPVVEMDDETWDLVIDVNLKGTFYCCRAVLPTMLAKKSGAIVNLSSMMGWLGGATESPYCAAKAGIVGFTKSLAQEVAAQGIRVNAIAPGLIYNEFLARAVPAEAIEKMRDATPIGRAGEPEDIAKTVLYLVSDQSSFVVGETISVSGGLYMH